MSEYYSIKMLNATSGCGKEKPRVAQSIFSTEERNWWGNFAQKPVTFFD